MTEHPIDVATRLLGGQAALASALGVSRGAVPQWKQSGRQMPAEYCPIVERLTIGQVTCEQLRPDIEWDVLRLQKAPKRNRRNSERRTAPAPRPTKTET